MTLELVSLAKNPIPSGAVCGTFAGHDGAPLRYALWPPSRGERRGTVCLFQGRAEFIEKYFEVVADLRRRGLAVATMDWRGQGGSHRALANPRKGYVRDFSEYDRDLTRFMRDIVMPDCPPPYTALAHSTGGNILLRAASQPGCWFEKMVLVAPMIRLSATTSRLSHRGMASVMSAGNLFGAGKAYVPGGGDTNPGMDRYEDNVLTSDRERFQRNLAVMQAEPRLQLGSPTFSWLRAALRSMDMISRPDYAARIKVPLLFVIAGEDKVVSPRAIEDFAVRVKLASHIVIPHARHEILQERDDLRQQFWAAFDAYLGIDRA